MHPTFIEKLGLTVQSTNISIKKIDSTIFKIYRMVVMIFSVIEQANKIKFFKETFLVVNISLNVVFEMPFFILNGTNINFSKRKL